MSHDVLHEATRALRNTTPERPQVGDLTRARIMQSLHRKKRRGATRALVWFPLAAIFIGASAAAATGKLPRVWNVVTSIVGLETIPLGTSRTATARLNRAPLPHRMPLPIPRTLPELALEPFEPPQPEAAPREVPEAPDGAVVPTPVVTAPSALPAAKPKVTPEQARAYALYREAHAVHFGEQAPDRALAAWNRYLAKYPDDRLAPEARYNRALCLVRLGRYAEASPALKRFGNGQYGGYRQRDARRLLEAISPLDDEPSEPVSHK